MPITINGSGTIAGASAFSSNAIFGGSIDAGGRLFCGRENTSAEGGQISFGRASDNSEHYSIDAYGSGSTPSLRFIDSAVGAVRMTIDSAGRITKPFNPAFHVYNNTNNGNWMADVNGVVLWNVVVFNTGSHYNTTTGRFTAPVAGKYLFNVRFLHNGANGSVGTFSAYIRKNGGNYPAGQLLYHSYVTWVTCSNVVMVDMNVNDYVDVNVGDGTWHDFHNEFSGFLIG